MASCHFFYSHLFHFLMVFSSSYQNRSIAQGYNHVSGNTVHSIQQMPYKVCENVSKEALCMLLHLLSLAAHLSSFQSWNWKDEPFPSEAKKDSIGGEIEIDIWYLQLLLVFWYQKEQFILQKHFSIFRFKNRSPTFKRWGLQSPTSHLSKITRILSGKWPTKCL